VQEGGVLSLLDRDGSTFVVRITDDKTWIWVGRIIVGFEDGGYIRRIIEARRTRDVLVLETAPASIADALIAGEVGTVTRIGAGSLHEAVRGGIQSETTADESLRAAVGSVAYGETPPIDNSGTAAAARKEESALQPQSDRAIQVQLSPGVFLSGGGLHLSGVTLLESGTGERRSTIVIADGFISFNPIVETTLAIRNGSVERFEAGAWGMLHLDCDLIIDAPEEIDAAGELPLAAFSTTVTRQIGTVPFIETVTLGFFATFEITGSHVGTCEAGFSVETPADIGISYENGAWTETGSIDPSLDASPLACAAFADADITIRVEPRIDVSFYSEPGVKLELAPRFHAHAETPAAPVWKWIIEGGVLGTTSVHPAILDDRLIPHAGTPVDHCEALGSGPFSTDSYVFVTSWGSEGDGDGQFRYPRGAVTGVMKSLYVVDSGAHRIKVFNADSTFINSWGGQGTGNGLFHFPNRIAVDETGTVFAVDAGNHRIQKFLPDGSFLAAWGSEGTGNGQFKDPQGIAARDGYVYVTDCFTHRLSRFTYDGEFDSAWGSHGNGIGELNCPMGIDVDGAGNIYVSECRNHRIQVFTTGGEVIRWWGSHGSGEGEFNCPIDVAVDNDGTVYVVDYGNDRIQVFASDGRFLTKLGSTGTGEGQFDQPEGIAVAPDGQIFIVDSKNRRIQRFAPKVR
jgi:DNA-binding beta-propeller fold protein YncE